MELCKKINELFSLIPSSRDELDVNPMSLLVYCSIRRHMNKNTRTAYPSMETICDMCLMTRPTLLQHINILEEKGYFKVTRRRKQNNIYHFPEIEIFEPFSLEFLDNKKLTPQNKAYIIATLPYMKKDPETMSGTIVISNRALAKQIHMSESSIRKCNTILELNGYLTQSKTSPEKIFNLSSLGQKIVFTLLNHEQRLQANEQSIEDIKEKQTSSENKIDALSKQIEEMQKEIESLRKKDKDKDNNRKDFELYL